ncbi:response regulator receiver domain [Mesorhizobium sp. M0482]|uniref:response regulator receiver domain n=1 Tax=Mesorhizobium sp. M0482 TaxID=2956948 RepID=UPI00333AB80F
MTAIREFALEATRKYLQSVVFVDDMIYQAETSKPMAVVEGPQMASVFKKPAPSAAPSTAAVVAAPAAAATSGTEGEPEAPPYHPKQLVESFAKERMVCALYEPAKGFASGPDSELFRLCERADVVILDWDLYNEDGKNILPLIAGLVSDSQTTVPHHVRLCAIYTTKPDLVRVTSQIYDHLKKEKLQVEAHELMLTAGASRIVVLGKPTTGRPEHQKTKAEVSETDLADRIIREFAGMHEGILPSAALYGMGAVRTSSKKILDKFSADMDGAFLVHRALLLPADDAYEQLPELLAEEALALMMDNRFPADLAARLSDEAIESRNIKLQLPLKDKRPKLADGTIAVNILKGGLRSVEKDFDTDKQKGLTSLLHEAMGANANATNMRLAALFSTRTSYSGRKDLTFGTVVRDLGEKSDFLLCLMPLCDSIRLSSKAGKSYSFPFWKLRADNCGAPSRGIVVKTPDGVHRELFVLGRPRDQLQMITFSATVSGTVVAVQKDGKHVLTTASSDLEWICQLKPNHAQRIAQDVGGSFARIGLVEAEWLRLKSERG